MYINNTNYSTCRFAQEKNNHISNGLCSYALVYRVAQKSKLLYCDRYFNG